jgi:hypothetical protein
VAAWNWRAYDAAKLVIHEVEGPPQEIWRGFR